MKRKNKCVATKRAYPTIGAALPVVKKAYIKDKRKLSLYECPVCLDFHLTRQGKTNLQFYYDRWDKELTKNFTVGKYHKKNQRKKANIRNRIAFIYTVLPKIDYSKTLCITLRIKA